MDFRLDFLRNETLPIEFGAQGPMTSSKTTQTYPSYDDTYKKTQIQIFQIFYIETTRLVP